MENLHGNHHNGAKAPRSQIKKKTNGPTKQDYARALKAEKRRNAYLVAQLKNTHNKNQTSNEWFEEPSNAGDDYSANFMRRNSTVRESFHPNGNDISIFTSMSFASLNIGECKPSDGDDDVDKKSFEHWQELLEASMQFAGVMDEYSKMSIFKIKAGSKLMETLDGTTSRADDPDISSFPYSNVMCRLKRYFNSRDYVLLQRQKLRSMSQKVDESDLKYVKRVAAIAKLCDYNEDQMIENIADVVQSHALNLKVREAGRKIMRKGGKLTELFDKIRGYEIETLNEQTFMKNHQQPRSYQHVAAVNYEQRMHGGRFRPQHSFVSKAVTKPHTVAYNQTRPVENSRYRGIMRGGMNRNVGTGQKPCWRCTGNFHRAFECHAINKVCRNCQRVGHLERACNQILQTAARKLHVPNETELSSPTKMRKIAAITETEQDFAEDDKESKTSNVDVCIDQPLNSLPGAATGTISLIDRVELQIQSTGRSLNNNMRSGNIVGLLAGLPVEFLIDSGAEVNTVSDLVFEELMNDERTVYELKRGSDKPLKAYASPGEISVIASFVTELFISNDRPRYLEKFYVVANARPLLGRNTALRYSVLQLGFEVPIQKSVDNKRTIFPCEIFALSANGEFPKFNIPPVSLAYDKSIPPTRNIFTNIPPAFKEEAERRLAGLLSSGIIERVTDGMDKSFCSSLLVVPKGKDDIRLVVDLRGPNKCIIRSPFKMPTLDSILPELHKAAYFSTIDLSSAFFHVELHENSRHLTNFFAGNVTYRFKRLPFGLCNAPDIFQEILQTVVLADCPGTINYLDDVLVHGRTLEEHDENLERVLSRLRNHNVLLNDGKCNLAKESVKFIGFRFARDGISVEEDKIKAVKEFRTPETLLEVKSFLGLINFSERFIFKRADKTKHLRMLAKSHYFYWTQSEEDEFNFLKNEALKSIKKLGYFNHEDKTELYVDASPIGLGAVLVQYNIEGVPRIIACASKALTITEQKYPHTQKEALAMVWGVERFSYYLTSNNFTIRTDSEANQFIFGNSHRTCKRSMTRAESWALRLLPYRYNVERVEGRSNIADALSRLINKAHVDEAFDEDNDRNILYALDAETMNITWTDIELASESDGELEEVRFAIKSNNWPWHLRRYESEARELRVLNPMIFKGDKIVLPKALRTRALETAHQGHIGCGAMKKIMREYFWWPNMSKESVEYVKKCETCLLVSRRNPPIPLCSRQLPNGPWEILQIDFLTIPGCGSEHFLVVVDTYSRYLHVIEMKHTDARSTNAALCKIFGTWGMPLIIQSDNGPPFQGNEFIEHWEAKGVRVRKSIPLSPQSNGSVERQNQGIIKAIAGGKEDGKKWRDSLEAYTHSHNTLKPHSRLGVTPFELMVGWKYRGAFPCLWESDPAKEVDREELRENDATAKLYSKKYADYHRGAKAADIIVGDKVVIATFQRNKTDPTFSKERYTVIARDGAKVVVRNDCGVQIARNIQDIKRDLTIPRDQENNVEGNSVGTNDSFEEPLGTTHENRRTEGETIIATNHPENNEAAEENTDSTGRGLKTKSKRVVSKPKRFDDMILYTIFS